MKPTSRSLLKARQRFVELTNNFLPLSTKTGWRMYVNLHKYFPHGEKHFGRPFDEDYSFEKQL